jgi:hypothetical protein
MSKIVLANRAVITAAGPAMLSGSTDPTTAGGVPAALSSMYLQTTTPPQVWRKTGAPDTSWTRIVFTSAAFGYFGDGSDGAFTAPVGVTNLARDMFHTTVSVPNGATITMNGFRLYATRSIVVAAGGVISRDGNAAVANAGGVVSGGGNLLGTNGGGNGGTAGGAAGSASTDTPANFTGIGGAGGAGSGGAGGAAGTVTAIAAVDGDFRQVVNIVNGIAIARSGSYMAGEAGSGGGGGGGSGAGQQGGGGGAGGGSMCLCAPYVLNSGVIRARGGAGGNAVGANAGGGGGGGGGIVFLVANVYVGTAPDVSGGAAGSKNGTGVIGNVGSAGLVIQVTA